MKEVVFYHGAFHDTYEKQANEQGFTLGDRADFVQKVGYGLVCAYIHGCITDSEYDKILNRFQKKLLIKNLKSLSERKEEKTDAREN